MESLNEYEENEGGGMDHGLSKMRRDQCNNSTVQRCAHKNPWMAILGIVRMVVVPNQVLFTVWLAHLFLAQQEEDRYYAG